MRQHEKAVRSVPLHYITTHPQQFSDHTGIREHSCSAERQLTGSSAQKVHYKRSEPKKLCFQLQVISPWSSQYYSAQEAFLKVTKEQLITGGKLGTTAMIILSSSLLPHWLCASKG